MPEWLPTRSRRNLVLALVIAGGFTFAAGAAGRAVIGRIPLTMVHEFRHSAGQDATYERSFDVGSGGRLEVQVGDADVRIAAGEGSEARVVIEMKDVDVSVEEALEQMGLSIEAEGGALRIRQDSHGWSGRGHDDYDMSLEVTVPRRFDVSVRTGDGDISFESVEGTVELQAGDGDVSIERASGPEIRIQTGDGDIYARSLVAEELRVQTGDGDILIEELAGSLIAATGDGDVQLHIERFDGLQIRTGDGAVTV